LLAIDSLVRAGYDPQAFLTAFDGWPGEAPGDDAKAHALSLSALNRNPVVDTSAFEAIRARLAARGHTAAKPPHLQ
jgi:hypothetical protein